MRIAGDGSRQLGEAIENYCRFELAKTYDSMTVGRKKDVLTDPAYWELFLEAATWAFKQIEPNVTDEAIEFIIPRLQGRYPTVLSFKAIYEQYLKQQESQQRNELLEPFNASPERTLDDLTDAEINNLKSRTLREFSRQIKHPKKGAIIK